MRPDPRADCILRWRYAIVAESLRASARDAEEPGRAQILLKIADRYAQLAAPPRSKQQVHLRVVADTGTEFPQIGHGRLDAE